MECRYGLVGGARRHRFVSLRAGARRHLRPTSDGVETSNATHDTAARRFFRSSELRNATVVIAQETSQAKSVTAYLAGNDPVLLRRRTNTP